jgi:hypothetical protein
MSYRSIAPIIAAVLFVFSTIPAAVPEVSAQDLKYTTKTSMELPGRAGTALRWAQRLAGGSSETLETVYLKDARMRTDTGESSVILDVEHGRMTFLDHGQRSFSVMTFADAMSMTEAMLADAETSIEEARRQADEARAEADEAGRSLEEEGIEIKYDLKVERTGETKSVLGHRAERVLMIMQAEGSRAAQAEEEEDFEGALVLATEMWLTNDASGELAPLFTFHERSAAAMSEQAQSLATSAQSLGDGLAAAFASDPRMKEMTAKAAEEMAKMEGVSLASTMKMVMVPGGLTFDSKAAFAPEEPREEVSTGQRAGRLARGLIRNRLGRGGNDEPAEEETPRAPSQSTLLTVKTEITDVSRASLENTLFEAPADYRESPLFQGH